MKQKHKLDWSRLGQAKKELGVWSLGFGFWFLGFGVRSLELIKFVCKKGLQKKGLHFGVGHLEVFEKFRVGWGGVER